MRTVIELKSTALSQRKLIIFTRDALKWMLKLKSRKPSSICYISAIATPRAEIKRHSLGLWKRFFHLLSCGAANAVSSEWLERWSKSDKIMNAIVKRTVRTSLFIRPVLGFIAPHVDSTIDDCYLTQLYVEARNMDKTSVALLPNRPYLDATEKFKNTLRRDDCKYCRCEQEERSSCEFQWPRRSKSSKYSWYSTLSPRRKDRNSHRSYGTRSVSSSR